MAASVSEELTGAAFLRPVFPSWPERGAPWVCPTAAANPDREPFLFDSFVKQLIDRVQVEAQKRKMQQMTF